MRCERARFAHHLTAAADTARAAPAVTQTLFANPPPRASFGPSCSGPMHDLTDLYQSVILDHNRRPRNYQVLPTANRVGSGNNPLCGDEVTVYVKLDGDRIADISFQGSGCAISQASASLMTVNLKGKTIAEAEQIAGDVMKLITSGQVNEDEISDLSALAGVHQFPARIKCATLSWHAALNAAKGDPAPVTTEKGSD